MITDNKQKICLTIAGVDPSGGAGIIADIKTFSAFGCFATAAITSITFQNTQGVFGAVHNTADTVRRQIEPILDDYTVAALKTGMLPTKEIIEDTARLIKENKLKNLVVDPVVRSTSGFDLIDDEALRSLIQNLFPLSDIITPNTQEAERITGMRIDSAEDIAESARIMRKMGARNVLIKGGHLPILDSPDSKSRTAKDFLFVGDDLTVFGAEYIETTDTHGTGCTLAAAITANLALGKDLVDAVRIAKQFVNRAIRSSPQIGRGNSPVNQLIAPE